MAVGFLVALVARTPEVDPAVAEASVGAPSTEQVEPSRSVAASPSDTPSSAPSATPVATASPVPTFDGPPHEVAVGGWATVVVDELNVRNAAGLDAPRVYGLVRGAIVHVADGPLEVEGRYWYSVASLGGATGWSTSGSVASPSLRTVSRGGDFLHCGPVTSAVFVDDGIRPVEVLRIGDVALPGGAFDGGALGSLELVRAVGADACVGAVLGSDGRPVVHAEVSGSACGHPVQTAAGVELRPRAGMNVVTEYQVRDVATIHPELLDPLARGDVVTANLRAVLALAAQDENSWGCIHHNARSGGTGSGGIQLDFRQCAVVELVTDARIEVRAPAATDRIAFLRPPAYVDESISLGVGAPVIVWGFDGQSERYTQIAWSNEGSCP